MYTGPRAGYLSGFLGAGHRGLPSSAGPAESEVRAAQQPAHPAMDASADSRRASSRCHAGSAGERGGCARKRTAVSGATAPLPARSQPRLGVRHQTRQAGGVLHSSGQRPCISYARSSQSLRRVKVKLLNPIVIISGTSERKRTPAAFTTATPGPSRCYRLGQPSPSPCNARIDHREMPAPGVRGWRIRISARRPVCTLCAWPGHGRRLCC